MINLEILKSKADDRYYIVEECRDKTVLEVGCVNHSIKGIKGQQKLGIWLFDYLNKYSKKATGIDIDKDAVKYLQKKGYDVRIGDAQNFNLKIKYDVIIASKLVDHLLNLDGFFVSCRKHLKPGGKLIISDDNILSLPVLFTWYYKKRLGSPDKDITVKIIPEYYRLFVVRYGFEVDSIKYISGTGNSALFRLFKKLIPFAPSVLKYEPLLYPNYIVILRRI